MTVENHMIFIFLDKLIQFLDSGNDDFCFRIFELFLEFCGTGIAICGSFFELIIFFHRLIIQIFSIYDKYYFINRG